MRPLEDVKVLDFSTLLPGPMASLLLAEAGAAVIKIERPGTGDEMRYYSPSWGDAGAIFAMLNRGKQSLALDLKDPSSIALLHTLVADADVVLEQFRPGVMDRLGLGYEALSAINPRLIYCSITAYGQTGAKRDVAGHDLNLVAETGFLTLAGDGDRPALLPTALADIAGGSYPAMINILLALRERDGTGRGRHIDIALHDNLFTFGYWALAQGGATGAFPGRGDNLVTGVSPRYRLYRTRDGGTVAAAPIEPKFWSNFCDLLDLDPVLRDDARDPVATAAAIAAIVATEDAATWADRFAAVDCCCTVAVGMEQAVADPHARERGLFDHGLVNERGDAMPALPVPIDPAFRGPPGEAIAAPPLGNANASFAPEAARAL